MIIAVVGSRDYKRLDLVRRYVLGLPDGTTIVSGGAVGVDKTAEQAALERGFTIVIIPAGKNPKERNRTIAKTCEQMTAFWDGKSGGTANVVAWAAYYNRIVEVIL